MELTSQLTNLATGLTNLLSDRSLLDYASARFLPPSQTKTPRSNNTGSLEETTATQHEPQELGTQEIPLLITQTQVLEALGNYGEVLSKLGIPSAAIHNLIDLFQQVSPRGDLLEHPLAGHIHREATLLSLRNSGYLPRTPEDTTTFISELMQASAGSPVISTARLFKNIYFSPPRMTDYQDPTHTAFQIPGFTLKKYMGSGAHASVFLAENRASGQEVIVKIGVEDAIPFSGLTNEYRFQADLRLKHVVRAYRIGVTRGRFPYIVLEYYPRGHLNLMTIKNELTFEKRITLAREILQAVAEIHDLGITHSDIKPGNILLDNYGHPYIADFGIASSAGHDPQILFSNSGTHGFRPPEHLTQRGNPLPVVPTKDVYALGMILLMLLRQGTEKPHSHFDAITMIHHSGFNQETIQFLERCLARAPSARFQNAKDCLQAFNAFTPTLIS